MRKQGFIAINTSDVKGTSEYLGNIAQVMNIQLGLYGADILAEVYYEGCPNLIYEEVKKGPGVFETTPFFDEA